MSTSRRTVLAALAGGALAGCSASTQTTGAQPASSSSTSAPPSASPSRTGKAGSPRPAGATRAEILARYGDAVPHTWGFDAPGVLHRLPAGQRGIALSL